MERACVFVCNSSIPGDNREEEHRYRKRASHQVECVTKASSVCNFSTVAARVCSPSRWNLLRLKSSHTTPHAPMLSFDVQGCFPPMSRDKQWRLPKANRPPCSVHEQMCPALVCMCRQGAWTACARSTTVGTHLTYLCAPTTYSVHR